MGQVLHEKICQGTRHSIGENAGYGVFQHGWECVLIRGFSQKHWHLPRIIELPISSFTENKTAKSSQMSPPLKPRGVLARKGSLEWRIVKHSAWVQIRNFQLLAFFVTFYMIFHLINGNWWSTMRTSSKSKALMFFLRIEQVEVRFRNIYSNTY